MRALALLPLALLLATPARATNAAVKVEDFAFKPATVTIKAGESVTWTLAANEPNHTVTADDNSFNGSLTSATPTYSHTFPSQGSFPYHCSIHTSMTGTVNVQSTTGSPSAKPTTPSPKPSSASPRPTVTRTTAAPAPTRSSAAPSLSPTPSAAATASTTPSAVPSSPSASPSPTGVTLEDLPQADEPGEPRTGLAIVLALLITAAAFGGAAFLWRRRRT